MKIKEKNDSHLNGMTKTLIKPILLNRWVTDSM